MLARRILVLGFAAHLFCACDGDPRAIPSPPAREAQRPAALEPEGSPQEAPPSAWPEHVESLEAALDRFTSVEACVGQLRESTPGEVAEVLSDLQYHGFFDDTCRSLAAAHARDPARCELVSVAPLRQACRARAAAIAGRPDDCPDDPVAGGRDATCLAWALRAPLLCQGATSSDKPTCEAVLAQDASRCRRPDVTERAQCEARVARWGSLLGEARAPERAQTSFTARAARVEERAPSIEVASAELDFGSLAARGVVLEALAESCRYRIALTDGLSVGGILARPALALTVELPAGATLPYTATLASLSRALTLSAPGVGSSRGLEGEARIEALEARRGGAVTILVQGRGDLPLSELRMTASLQTFVRDIENLPADCVSVDEGSEMPHE